VIRLDNGGGTIEAVAILLRQLAENIKTLPVGPACDAASDAHCAVCFAITESVGEMTAALVGLAGRDTTETTNG